MADKKISELTNITGANLADADEFVVVDTSATETKAITFGELKNAFDTSTGFVRITGDTMTGDLTIPDKIIHSGDTNTAIRFPSNDTVTVETSGSERMRIGGLGNVGIGTSSPSAKLEVLAEVGTNVNAAALLLRGYGNPHQTNMFIYGKRVANPNADVGSVAFFNDEDDNGIYTEVSRIVASGDGDIKFHQGPAGGTERMRIDSSGNVGIGTSSPSGGKLVVSGNGLAAIKAEDIDGAGTFVRIVADTDSQNSINWGSGSDLKFATSNSDFSSYVERMRITQSGNVGIGTSSPSAKLDVAGSVYFDSTFGVGATGSLATESGPINGFYYSPSVGRLDLASDSGVIQYWNRTGSAGQVINIRYAGATVGNIAVTSTSTSYNTSSDYRLKEDVQPMVGAVDRVLALNPVNFAWKADGSRVDGFLAHEAQAVVPEAVTGEKDAVDADGKPVYQAIDQSKLVPLLTAALQEALGRIETLEAEVAALKA